MLRRPTARGPLFTLVRPRWWFVASAPLGGDLGRVRQASITLTVRSGTVGVSFVGSDESAVVSEVEMGVGRGRADISTPESAPCPRKILFRSVDFLDRPAVFVVESIWLRG